MQKFFSKKFSQNEFWFPLNRYVTYKTGRLLLLKAAKLDIYYISTYDSKSDLFLPDVTFSY